MCLYIYIVHARWNKYRNGLVTFLTKLAWEPHLISEKKNQHDLRTLKKLTVIYLCPDGVTRVEYTFFLKRNAWVHEWISFSLLVMRSINIVDRNCRILFYETHDTVICLSLYKTSTSSYLLFTSNFYYIFETFNLDNTTDMNSFILLLNCISNIKHIYH